MTNVELYTYQLKAKTARDWVDMEGVFSDKAALEKAIRTENADWIAKGKPPLDHRIVTLTPTKFEPIIL